MRPAHTYWDDNELSEEDEVQLQFAALASPIRRYLLELLEVDDASAGELAASASDRWGITRARASQQLRLLVEAGLVTVHPDGSWRYYRRVPRAAQPVGDWLSRHDLSR